MMTLLLTMLGVVVLAVLAWLWLRPRRALAEARRIAEARFAGIVSIASEAIITTAEDQTILHFNSGAEEIFGYAAAEIIGQHVNVLIPERYRRMHPEHVREFGRSPVQARRMGERREISGLRKNGEEFPAEASISKLEIEGERYYTVVMRDVSERHRFGQTQALLARAGELLAVSLETEETLASVARLIVPDIADWCVIHITDEQGSMVRAAIAHRDPAVERQLTESVLNVPVTNPQHPLRRVMISGESVLLPELTREDVMGMAENDPHTHILEQIDARSAILAPMVARNQTRGAIAFFRMADARPFNADDKALADEITRRAALAIDNARLYREAQRAIDARDDVLAVVSHDLGNPLSAIRIGTTLLLSGLSEAERETGGWKHIVGIRNSAAQMERLIKDLLEVKRIEAGQLTIERTRVAVAPLLEEAVELLAPIAGGKQVDLRARSAGDVGDIYADRERLLQTLSNLVGNAVKFTAPGGHVTIEVTRAASNEVIFSVADTGSGIAAADLAHVFDRYWQAKTRRRGRDGIGLGLVIVRSIVEAHGGRVWAESQVGAGSRFSFTVPAWQNQYEEIDD